MEKETLPREKKGVFISYSHDNPAHAERVPALANRLRADGIDCTIDQYEPHPPEGWPKWMADKVKYSRFVLILCTKVYLDRSENNVEPDTGKGVKWESLLTFNMLYAADSRNERFLPVVFCAEDEAFIPLPLQGYTFYRLDSAGGYEALCRRLSDSPLMEKPPLGPKKPWPAVKPEPLRFQGESAGAPEVSLSRLPAGGQYLLGRESELSLLDQAWAREGVRLFTVVAFGGVGKSALVNEWLVRLASRGYGGAARVWGWSFYSQGSGDARGASADTFMDTALREFGDPDPSAGTAWERGVRLARLVRRQKTLLVLDGLEPLQHPRGPAKRGGFLKDGGLQALLKELAFLNPGLCVVTSRLRVEDLSGKCTNLEPRAPLPGETKPVWLLCLDRLEPETGGQLLRRHGVTGPDKELFEKNCQSSGGNITKPRSLQPINPWPFGWHPGKPRRPSTARQCVSAPPLCPS